LIISPTTRPVIPSGCRNPAPWAAALGYSHGGLCTRLFSRRDADGRLTLPGTGSQHPAGTTACGNSDRSVRASLPGGDYDQGPGLRRGFLVLPGRSDSFARPSRTPGLCLEPAWGARLSDVVPQRESNTECLPQAAGCFMSWSVESRDIAACLTCKKRYCAASVQQQQMPLNEGDPAGDFRRHRSTPQRTD